MALQVDARVLELLAARLCHDLIGPVSAIGNGVELLADEDPDFARDAIALIGDSARNALRRLQFYRFAYGFRPGGVASAEPCRLITDLFEGTALFCEYPEPVRALPLERQKLACNMAAVAAEGLPRGGRISLTADGAAIRLEASGEGEGPSGEICQALALSCPVEALTPRSVGGYLTGLVAQGLGCRVRAIGGTGGFRIEAVP